MIDQCVWRCVVRREVVGIKGSSLMTVVLKEAAPDEEEIDCGAEVDSVPSITYFIVLLLHDNQE